MQNHRGVMKLPQGDSTEISKVDLQVPEAARASRDAMREWLHTAQRIDVESARSPSGRGGDAGRRSGGGAGDRGKARWMFNGGNARIQTQVEYLEGSPSLTIHKTQKSPLAILESLHKGVGGGIAWIVLTDSFAVAMVTLGISGLILWARGRNTRGMVFSIVGVAVIVLLVIGGSAII